jgi:hypothetical protein
MYILCFIAAVSVLFKEGYAATQLLDKSKTFVYPQFHDRQSLTHIMMYSPSTRSMALRQRKACLPLHPIGTSLSLLRALTS